MYKENVLPKFISVEALMALPDVIEIKVGLYSWLALALLSVKLTPISEAESSFKVKVNKDSVLKLIIVDTVARQQFSTN